MVLYRFALSKDEFLIQLCFEQTSLETRTGGSRKQYKYFIGAFRELELLINTEKSQEKGPDVGVEKWA